MPPISETPKTVMGLSTAHAYAVAKGLPLSSVFEQFDVEDDRDAPDTPDGLHLIGKLPVHPTAPKPGSVPRRRGDVIDTLAERRGGSLPVRKQAEVDDRLFVEPTIGEKISSSLAGGLSFAGDTLGGIVAGTPETAINLATALPRSIARGGREFIDTGSPSKAFTAAKNTPRYSEELYHGADLRTPMEAATHASDEAGQAVKDALGVQPNAITDTYEASARNVPALATAIAGGVKSLRGRVPSRPATAIGENTELGPIAADTLFAPEEHPPEVHAINKAIGPGAVDTVKEINVGKHLYETDAPIGKIGGKAVPLIDEQAVKRNPAALRQFADDEVTRADLKRKDILKSQEANRPQANVETVMDGARKRVAVLSPAEQAAADSVENYIRMRTRELSAAHGPEHRGMLSPADADLLQNELQGRANFDRIFKGVPATTAAEIKNQALARYSGAFGQVADTLPGYSALNDRMQAMIHLRDKVLPPVVDSAMVGAQVPSRTAATVKLAGNAARGDVAGAIRNAGDIAASRQRMPTPLDIARAVNKNARGSTPISTPEVPTVAVPDSADFAATADGDTGAVPTRKTIAATQRNVSRMASDADVLQTKRDRTIQPTGRSRRGSPDFAAGDTAGAHTLPLSPRAKESVVVNQGTSGAEVEGISRALDQRKNERIAGGAPTRTSISNGRTVRDLEESPRVGENAESGRIVVPADKRTVRSIQREEGRLPQRKRPDPNRTREIPGLSVPGDVDASITPDFVGTSDGYLTGPNLLSLDDMIRINDEAAAEMKAGPARGTRTTEVYTPHGTPPASLTEEQMLNANRDAERELTARRGNPNKTTARPETGTGKVPERTSKDTKKKSSAPDASPAPTSRPKDSASVPERPSSSASASALTVREEFQPDDRVILPDGSTGTIDRVQQHGLDRIFYRVKGKDYTAAQLKRAEQKQKTNAK